MDVRLDTPKNIKVHSPLIATTSRTDRGSRIFVYIKVKSIPEFILMKPRYITPIILLSLTLFACASVSSVTPVTSGPTQIVEPGSTTPAPVITTPAYEGCAFMWASHDLPDLSQKVGSAFKVIDPNLTGSAYAYGEDCVYADGHSTFSTMETDFRVKVSVNDLQDEKSLGDWIFNVMVVITKLPAGEIPGPQPGRVEFQFSKSESETLNLSVSIAKFKSQAAGLTGAELFKLFNNNP
jgi:hypothetical protein